MISIIVPWKNRREIYRTISAFVDTAQTLHGEVILVNYCGDLDQRKLPESPYLRIIHVSDREFFNKASANNIGGAQARFDKLFFCDCDILLRSDTVDHCCGLLEASLRFVTIAHVQEETLNSLQTTHVQCFGYNMIIKTRDGRQVEIIDFEEDTSTGLRNAPGLLFCKREDFNRINGYGSFLHGWGWEDQDMICRLTLGAGLLRQQHGTLTHLSHDDNARMQEYPLAASRWESRDRMFRTALSRYDQNLFQGTMNEDIESHTFVETIIA